MEARNGQYAQLTTTGYSNAISTDVQSMTLAPTETCQILPSVACVLALQPEYILWSTDLSEGSNPVGTIHISIDTNGITTSKSIDCNWNAVSTNYSFRGGLFTYTVDSDCNFVAYRTGETTGTETSAALSVTYPNTVAHLGSEFDVSTAATSDGTCTYYNYRISTTAIDYTDSFSVTFSESKTGIFWDFPDLASYLPGFAAATECTVTFATTPNTLQPASYLTVYNRATATSTASQQEKTSAEDASTVTVTSDGVTTTVVSLASISESASDVAVTITSVPIGTGGAAATSTVTSGSNEAHLLPVFMAAFILVSVVVVAL